MPKTSGRGLRGEMPAYIRENEGSGQDGPDTKNWSENERSGGELLDNSCEIKEEIAQYTQARGLGLLAERKHVHITTHHLPFSASGSPPPPLVWSTQMGPSIVGAGRGACGFSLCSVPRPPATAPPLSTLGFRKPPLAMPPDSLPPPQNIRHSVTHEGRTLGLMGPGTWALSGPWAESSPTYDALLHSSSSAACICSKKALCVPWGLAGQKSWTTGTVSMSPQGSK